MSGDTPVVVLGGINMDLVVEVAALPRPGETVLGGDMRRFGGGKGANQAVAAARMRAATHLIGRVGTDDLGDALLAGLRNDGVEVRGVLRDSEAPTGVALIGVDASGNNSIIVSSGANARVSEVDLDAAQSVVGQGGVLVANFEVPADVVMVAAARSRASRGQVILNLAPALVPPDGLLARVDVLVVNETEGAMLAGRAGAPADLAAELLTRGPRSVVLTVGAEGAWVAQSDGVVHLRGHRVQVVDSTAAGDAFIGALAAELARGARLVAACHVANAAGALAVIRSGAQPSLPRLDQVTRFLEETARSAHAATDHH